MELLEGLEDEFLEEIDLPQEIDRLKAVFEQYKDIVRAKMTEFFLLSFKVSSLGQSVLLNESIHEIENIYQWMLDKGELHYSEMIGQFLEVISKFERRS
ncbi:MAG: hypothetical protein ACTSRO_01255 [Candidatus Heimdallarchaeaceae archaeon]